MRKHYTQTEKDVYKAEQARIKAAQERFDTFLCEQGWTKFHLFMRGTKWTNGNDIIIYDANGWHFNDEIITEQELHKRLHYV